MGPGGVTENLLAHFAGYFHFGEDFVRSRLAYDPGDFHHYMAGWTPEAPQDWGGDKSLADLKSTPYKLVYAQHPDSLIEATLHKLHPDHPPAVHCPDLHEPHPIAPLTVDAGGGGGGGSETIQVSSPTIVPQQLLAELAQVNDMHTDNVFLMVPGSNPSALHPIDINAVFDDLWASSQAARPQDLIPSSGSNESLLDLVRAYDSGAPPPDTNGEITLNPGAYHNGVLEPAGTTFDVPVPNVNTPSENINHNGMLDPGLNAQTGGNVSVNQASIVDDNTERTGLVVEGNAYNVNAILQVNALSNHWSIDVGGKATTLDISTGGDSTNNDATFTQHSVTSNVTAQFSPSSNVHVTTINGDFLDIKGVFQTNYLSNNDVVVQGATSTYNEVDSGQNGQFNALPLSEFNGHYDLIIVEGDYHTWNVVEQTNLLLNNNADVMDTSRGDTAQQTVSVGGNTLTNDASIDTYGNSQFQPLTSSVNSGVTGLENGSLSQEIASLLAGNGGNNINVLVVTGNFYDLNFISQTNVVSNVDTVAQYLPNTGQDTAPTGAPTSSTETINSGGNQLANFAGIASVGTTSNFQYVGGQAYSDAVLVQANLVSQGGQVVTSQGGGDLAAELQTLTGLHDASAVSDATPHDLFHGVMS